MLKPSALREGDTVATISLSWGGPGTFPHRYEAGKRQLEETFGLKVVEAPNALRPADWVYTVSEKLGVPHNTLSFHLSHMSNAGLVQSRREGRSIIYSANFEFFTGLLRYMVEDCCRADFASIREDKKSGASIIELMNCCPPKKEKKS